jgi:glycosyltransferase involved in cell wall biosynthesis
MKIAFDGQPLEKNPAGRGTYLLNLLDYLTNHKVFCYIFSHHDVYLNSFPTINKRNIKTVVDRPKRDGYYYHHNYFTWRKTILPYRLCQCDAQIFHQISNFGVPSYPIPQKIALTMHDIVPMILPKLEFAHEYDKLAYELEIEESLFMASKIIFISKSTQSDVRKYFGECYQEKKGKVIYNGLNKFSANDLKIKPKKFSFDYLICNAGFTEKKNTHNVIKTFAFLKKYYPNFKNLKLIITGAYDNPVKESVYQELKSLAKKLKLGNQVIFTGQLSRLELGAYIKGAKVLLYLSQYEGFGFPPLEGMSLGCPVITSNTSSMPEVVGNAAITVNPFNIKMIAAKTAHLLKNEKSRIKLTKLGLKQAQKFSWGKCAKEVLKVYKSLLK